MRLSNYLKKYREAHNLTQVEMAERINTTQTSYSFLESGRLKPGIQLVKKIAEYFELPVEEIRKMCK